MRAVIVAGGKGTRLSKYTNEIPKPMIKVNGVSLLERQINNLKSYGINDITIVVGYLGDVIKKYFQDGVRFGVNIDYITETVPLGSAGFLYFLKNTMTDDFVVLFADLIIDIDFNKFLKFHKKNDSLVTLFTHPNSHPFDSDLLTVDENDIVIGFDSKTNNRKYWYHNIVNAGIFMISPEALNYFDTLQKVDMEHDFVKGLISTKRVYSYQSSEYVKDAGTIDRLDAVEKDLISEIVTKRNLTHPQKCIFLDRDGTINVYRGHLHDINQFDLINGVSEAIRKINSSEYLSIVISNQPVISRGDLTFEGLDEIHKKMETLLGKGGAYLNGIYFCPHYPESGFKGEVKELKIDCDCRKPKIGLILKAKEKFNIDLSKSWFIGDSDLDIECGRNAGCKTILITNGLFKNKLKPDYFANNLLEAVKIILSE